VASIEWNRNSFLTDIVQGVGWIVLGVVWWKNKQKWVFALWLVLGILHLYYAFSLAYHWMGGRTYQPNLLAG
jgi:hypothetical protein